ncbi:MAG: ankyrin repeat domain-containing protein [Veillonellaceae bacterium]|nr:ankyrin repeat domain-containing protein [Veillonellaceae bacterium]
MKKMGRKWKLLCAGLVAAGVLVAGVPGEQMPVAEAMYSVKDAEYHWYKVPTEEQKAFMVAASHGDYGMVKELIDSGVDVNGVYMMGNVGYTAFEAAYIKNHRDIMQLLLENGADVNGYYNFNGEYRSYLLQEAGLWEPRLETIQYLVNWGADVNVTNELGNALEIYIGGIIDATEYNHTYRVDDDSYLEIARFLLDKGINPNAKDHWGENAFISAIGGNYKKIGGYNLGRWYSMAQLLADYGADYTARDRNGKDAVQIALDSNDLRLYKMMKAIIARGPQPSKYQPPAGTAISIDKPGGSRTGTVAQSHAGRGATATKFSEVFVKYNDASNAVYNELTKSLKVDMTKPEQKKAALSKEADAIKELRKLNEKMAKEDPLKGLKGYSVGEREKFTDAFDGIREKNEAMIAYMEYCVAHPDDAQEDQLTALTQAVLTAHETQKQRVDDVLALIKN